MTHTESQNKAILDHLNKGGKITSLEAWIAFGCSALHSRISDLRNRYEIPVKDKWMEVQTAHGKKRVKQYFL